MIGLADIRGAVIILTAAGDPRAGGIIAAGSSRLANPAIVRAGRVYDVRRFSAK